MAKRQRKTEQEFLKARSALMRSIQRTNKAFGSSMKISDIVDVPTPAQAKKMSAAELRQANKRIKEARTGSQGEKMTFVPTGAGGVTKVPTKDYNAAMANLGKRNRAARERIEGISSAIVPTEKGARMVSMKTVSTMQESKIRPLNEINPMMAFIGGGARGNVDEIRKRFAGRGKEFVNAPRDWQRGDELMRRNFLKMLGLHDIESRKILQKLTREQLLWAVYERNLPSLLEQSGYINTDPILTPEEGLADDNESKMRDSIVAESAKELKEVLELASRVVFR